MKNEIMALTDVAAGRRKAQLVFKNVKLVNVFTGEIYNTDVAVHEGRIAGIGEYSGEIEPEVADKYLVPGFIDAHVHIESSMVTPGEFARAVASRGTTTVIADPHEIANVKGMEGIEYILESTENLPVDFYIMLPSCVPATPFENSGSILKAADLSRLIGHPRVLGLGELMDFIGVINNDEDVVDKISLAKGAGKFIDGHNPLLKGRELNAYTAAGIRSEHECVNAEDAKERLRLGTHIMLREGSGAKNVIDLLPALNESSIARCMFCTDDRHPEDILAGGHIDNNIRLAIRHGVDPVRAVQIATLNAARCYNLEETGTIAPGYKADLVVLNDLENVEIYQVYKEGRLIASEGKALFDIENVNDLKMRNSVNIKPLGEDAFAIPATNNVCRVIGLQPQSLVTKDLRRRVSEKNGRYVTDEGNELLKIAVIERHKASGNIGLGLVEGLGLKNGAIASTVAHDSHNIIVIGDNDGDMQAAVAHLQEIGGGLAICSEGRVLRSLPLPIGGLMSDISLEAMRTQLAEMLELSYKMGVSREMDTFTLLSFLALPVIPELKLTDMGLFDVVNFQFTEI